MRIMKFFLVLLLLTLPQVIQADEVSSPESAVIISFFKSKQMEVEGLKRDAEGLQIGLNEQEAQFRPALDAALSRLQMLDVMARMVKTNPYDMRVALAEAKYLQKTLAKSYQPLEVLGKEIGTKLETAQALEADLERKWATNLDRELREDVLGIRKAVTSVSQTLKNIQGQWDKLRVTAQSTNNRTQDWITKFETELPLIWKAEFLDGAEFRLFPAPGTDLRKELGDWYANMKDFFVGQYSSVAGGSEDWVGTFFVFWIPFVLIGYVAFRFVAPVFPSTDAGGRSIAGLAILCLSLALSLLAAFLSGKVKQTSFLLVCTHVLMLLGAQALSWLFRNVRGVLQTKCIQPLLPLIFLSASVAILDLLRFPPWIEHQLWLVLVGLTSILFGLKVPPLRFERMIRAMHPIVMFALVIMAITGRGNLAMLSSTLWGILALTIQLAIGATVVVRVLFEQVDKTGLKALVADLSITFLSLVIWVCLAIGVMTWVTINLGTNAVFERLSSMELNWGSFSLNFLRLGAVLLLFQVTRSLAVAWKAVLETDHLQWRKMDRGAAASLQRIGIYCLWLLYALISLNLLGISLSNFAVIAGGLSVGIGFGMQNMISNFIAGLILLFDRAIQPGDVIEIDGLWAKVMSVNIRNTEVQTFENAKIFVPNSDLIAGKLTNWTHRSDTRIRRDVLVGVAYGSNVELVKKLLLEAAEEHPAVLSNPAPWIIFNAFGASSLDFVVRFWVRHVDLAVSCASEIRESIDTKFRDHGIEIPFTQMDIRIRPGDGVVHLKSE